MIDFRPIFLVVGYLLVTLAVMMCIPAVVDAAVGNPDWQVFLVAAGATLFSGISLVLLNRAKKFDFTLRQAFVMTTLSWIVLPAFGALPFAFSNLDLSYTDAFFESMSGFTTTGSTVIQGLDNAPPGILLWRGLMQWLGGIGIIVMAIAVMPMLRVGGMQLFRMEASDKTEKAMPRVAQVATAITLIYLGLSLTWVVLYAVAGMSLFDATVHSMTTIATGGFSSHDKSLGFFDSPWIHWVAVGGMIVGSLPFVLYLRFLQGHRDAFFRDSQVRTFLGLVAGAVLVATAFLWFGGEYPLAESLRFAAFNVISIITGTGYATTDFGQWGSFANPMFFFIMFIGGCAGSTTCGIKIFRFQVLYQAARVQLRHLVQPHGVFIPYFNRRPIPEEVTNSVLGFFFIFGVSFGTLAVLLSMLGLDYITAISAAATAISNVGPGLGETVGPAGNFTSLPDAAKWLMASGMLLGRLELFTVFVLFTRGFWRG